MKSVDDVPTFAAWHWLHAARSLTVLGDHGFLPLVEGIEDSEESLE
jgi:hypothetical protein